MFTWSGLGLGHIHRQHKTDHKITKMKLHTVLSTLGVKMNDESPTFAIIIDSRLKRHKILKTKLSN
jgi:hypothetical protein